MLIRSTDRFINLSPTGQIRYVGTIGQYFDDIIGQMGLQGNMGLQGLPGLPGEAGLTPYFRAELSDTQQLISGTPAVVQFDALVDDYNNPGFNAVSFSHLPSVLSGAELWMYVLYTSLISSGFTITNWLRTVGSQTSLASSPVEDRRTFLAVSRVWSAGDTDPVEAVVQCNASDILSASSGQTFWQGFRVGRLDEESPPTVYTYDGQVDRGEDDAHQAADGGGFSHSAVTLKAEENSDPSLRWNCAFVARGVNIPQGATVTEAYASVYPPFGERDSPRQTLYGNLVASAGSFASETTVNSRVLTNASAYWSGDDLGSGQFVQTVSLIAIIQEIIGQPSWVSGGNICILFFADTTAPEATRFVPFDNTPAQACKLHIVAQA